jgi:hypothetical protein
VAATFIALVPPGFDLLPAFFCHPEDCQTGRVSGPTVVLTSCFKKEVDRTNLDHIHKLFEYNNLHSLIGESDMAQSLP